MNNSYATDTMALVLRLEKRKMGSEAKAIYEEAEIDDIPELHDRIIAGTAYLKNLELITNDPIIIDSKYVSTIW